MLLNEKSPIPLYHQLENLIRERVKEEIYKEDEKIPSERTLNQELGVSRMTISKALNNLVEEGVLYRKRGQGTFVSKKQIHFFPGLMGFTEIIKNKNMKPSSKLISQSVILADKYLSEKLNISEGDKVILTERLRLADDKIVNLEKSYVPYSMCPKLLERDLTVESIYRLLSDEGYTPIKATQEVQAILSSEKLSEFLEININEAILKRKRVTYSKNDTPIEYSCNYYRGDIYTMVMTINS